MKINLHKKKGSVINPTRWTLCLLLKVNVAAASRCTADIFNRAWTETCKDTPLLSSVCSPGMGNKVVNRDVHRFPLLDVPQSCDYEVVVKCICAERKEHRSVQISSGKPHTKILTQQVLRPADFTYLGGQS